MNIREEKKIGIEMKVQLEEAIYAFQQDIGAAVTSPAWRHILTVEENCE